MSHVWIPIIVIAVLLGAPVVWHMLHGDDEDET